MNLRQLYDTRDYDSFGCLFGVMNFAGFEPVAAERSGHFTLTGSPIPCHRNALGCHAALGA
jgi:hypothetical protein